MSLQIGRDCPKCAQSMQPGFLATPGRETSLQVAWHPGEARPENHSFLGVDVGLSWVVALDPVALEPITVYRCPGCGYLEGYAH